MYPLPPEATVQPSVSKGEIKEYMGWAQSTVFPDTERDFWVYVSASYSDEIDIEETIKMLDAEMAQAAEALDYERAALLRDQLFELKAKVGSK